MTDVLLSFKVRGDFANFRDESVTTSHITYVIPPRATMIGLIASILGIERGNKFKRNEIEGLYTKEYINLSKSIKVGIKVLSKSIKKINIVTNHVSFVRRKVKPFKIELLENPNYEIFVLGEKSKLELIKKIIDNSEYKYTPFLGNAYCLATISDAKIFDSFEEVPNPNRKFTSAAIINQGNFTLQPKSDNDEVIVENHLYFISPDKKLTVEFWAPIGGDGRFEIRDYEDKNDLGLKFVGIDNKEIICMF